VDSRGYSDLASPSASPKNESLSLYLSTVYNDKPVFDLIRKLYTEKALVGTKKRARYDSRLHSITLLKKLLSLTDSQKIKVLTTFLNDPKYTQQDACKLADSFRVNNLVCERYIAEFSTLDNTRYNWGALIKKYPAIARSSTTDQWIAAFANSGRKSINPDLSENFVKHCLAIKEEATMRNKMSASTKEITVNDSSCTVIAGDCTLLDKVVPRQAYRMFSFIFSIIS
jgi:hypothetical protein